MQLVWNGVEIKLEIAVSIVVWSSERLKNVGVSRYLATTNSCFLFWVLSIEIWSGNSAKVFVLSFCSPLCQFAHGAWSLNPLYFTIKKELSRIAAFGFNRKTKMCARWGPPQHQNAAYYIVALKFAEFPEHISIAYVLSHFVWLRRWRNNGNIMLTRLIYSSVLVSCYNLWSKLSLVVWSSQLGPVV